MKKKMIFSVAAAAALLMANPAANKADAASNYSPQVQTKVYYQTGNMNNQQFNAFIQNYFKNFNVKWNYVQVQQPTQTAKQPTAPAKQPIAQAPAKQPTVQAPAKQPAQTQQQTTSSQLSAFEQKVVDLINKERANYGLSALKVDTALSKAARAKSLDMQAKGYFDHNSPTYGSPFDMMKQFGVTYRTAGENIAMGQPSPEAVVQAWMNSEGHRKNILNSSYTHRCGICRKRKLLDTDVYR